VVSKFLIFRPYESRRELLLTYLCTTRRWPLIVFIRWSAIYRGFLSGRSPLLFIVSWTYSSATVVSLGTIRRTLTVSSIVFPISGKRRYSSTAESMRRCVSTAAGMDHSCLTGSVGQIPQTVIGAKTLSWSETGWENDNVASANSVRTSSSTGKKTPRAT